MVACGDSVVPWSMAGLLAFRSREADFVGTHLFALDEIFEGPRVAIRFGWYKKKFKKAHIHISDGLWTPDGCHFLNA